MASQIDYMIAASIFLVVFAFTVNFVTDYYSDIRSTVVISSMKSEALSLLSIADFEGTPVELQQESGLVGLWHFNGDVKDYSGNNNNGTDNGVYCTAGGKLGSACSFDGINDYVNV